LKSKPVSEFCIDLSLQEMDLHQLNNLESILRGEG
jgi:hypothetical protein